MFAQDDIRVLIVDDNPDVHRDFRNNFVAARCQREGLIASPPCGIHG